MPAGRDRDKYNSYMREWTEKNKERLNKERRERRANLSQDELDRQRELSRIRNRRYHEKHKDRLNAKAKARNWDYDPEKAKTKRQEYYSRFPARNILRTVQQRAKNKDIPFNLTEEWYNEEFKNGCAVTGIQFALPRSGSPWTPHVDKIDPNGGYLMSNCRLVCAMYNQAKGKWSDEDVEDMAFCIVSRTSDA